MRKVRISKPKQNTQQPQYSNIMKRGGAPSIAAQNETIDSITQGRKSTFLDRVSSAAQQNMFASAQSQAEAEFVPPQLNRYGGIPHYNVGGDFGFAMNAKCTDARGSRSRRVSP